nr:centromere protein Q isoform X1 [Pogona vitticeps]
MPMDQARGAAREKMAKEQLEPSRKKRGTDGRQRKRNLQRQKGAQGVQEQQSTESPKAETASLYTKVLKVTQRQRAKWRPLPKSSREHLESTMHWLITSLLYKTAENHTEAEKHLNLLKKRLLKSLENLQVPMEKQSSLKNAHSFLAKEKTKSAALEDGLAELQDEIDKVVQAAEFREETIQRLQKEVQELKCELAAEEATASKLFYKDGNHGLALPDFSKDSLKLPILQNELLKIKNQQGLLNDLNTLQKSEEMTTMSAFLEEAYENVDSLQSETVR